MRARVTSINLDTSGQTIIPSTNVTVIVGPNNVGKSVILAGVQQEIALDASQPTNVQARPVSSIEVSTPPLEDYLPIVTAKAELFESGIYPNGTFYQPTYVFEHGTAIPQQALTEVIKRTTRFGPLAGSMMIFMGPEGRGGTLASAGLPDLMSKTVKSPVQLLWQDRGLESTISHYMQRAFGRKLFVNRHAGANIHLQIGEVLLPEPPVGVPSPYLDEALKLPMLASQGAGMLAFMGTVLTIAAGTYDIILLDEPEAFLHPPQARLLGEVVSEMSRDGGPQILVATHSDDFLQGVLNASRDDSDVSVVRITRPTDNQNRVAQVRPDDVKSLYRDPLLRYSNILDGMFYKGVVICEAESDCTYYAATLGYVETTKSLGSSDILFTQCGGKDRFKRAFAALDAAAIPTAVVADIDLLADKTKFEELFEAMGGNFAVIEASYNTLNSSVSNNKMEPERESVRKQLNEIIDRAATKRFSSADLRELSDVLRLESGWKQAKRKGEGSIDNGDPINSFNSILAACRDVGLFIVRIGELERFHPTVSGNKQEWLRKVLEQELFSQSSEAQSFVEEVRNFISSRQ